MKYGGRMITPMRIAVIIPVYNHAALIREVVKKTLPLGFPVIVVDDGSTDRSFDAIKDIPGIHILRHRVNCGKGAALKTGFDRAAAIADWAITIDADGQHNPLDARAMIQAIPEEGPCIILGMRRRMKAKAPWTSTFGRKFSNFWVAVSGGPRVQDSQSGFRIYPLPATCRLPVRADRYQYEVEVLVHARRNKIGVREVPVTVDYQPGGQRISHFRPFIDFMRNSETFCRLIFQRLFGYNKPL